MLRSRFLLIIGFVAIIMGITYSQVPGHFTYQAVLRNSNGDPIVDQTVKMRIGIIQYSVEGSIVYSESHLIMTNSYGLVNLDLGGGVVLSGDFTSINWSEGPYFIKVEVDAQGGDNYIDLGTTPMSSVPYAMFSDVNQKIRALTEAERNALTNPPTGMMILNLTTSCINYYNGSFWFEYCGSCIPQPAIAGYDLTDVCSPVQLGANAATEGTGSWSIYSGTGGTVYNLNNPTSLFSGNAGEIYSLIWTITSVCGSSSDTVLVSFLQSPTQANAGGDQLNLPGISANLQANTPLFGSGLWSIVSGSGGYFVNPSDPTTSFTGTPGTTYVLEWQISTACDTTYDQTTIGFEQGSSGNFSCGSDLTDPRDGKVYETVIIGNQCWMKENLNIGTRINGDIEQLDNSIIEKYCFNDLESNCDIYGGLYQWNELMEYLTTPGVQGICPASWHIPTKDEWDTLNTFVGWDSNALKEIGVGTGNGAGTNTSGFSALLSGNRGYGGSFAGLDASTGFWNSNPQTTSYSYRYNLSATNSEIAGGVTARIFGLSVRCVWDSIPCTPPTEANAGPDQLNIQDTVTTLAGNTPTIGTGQWSIVAGTGGVIADPSNPASLFSGLELNSYTLTWTISNECGSSIDSVDISFEGTPSFNCGGAFTDSRDGQSYNTVLIDSLCWMAENLNIGTVIDNGTDQTDNGIIEKHCSYNGIEDSCDVYGGLYQWNELMDYVTTSGTQGICPDSWHIPTDEEWKVLEGSVDSQYGVGDPEWDGNNTYRGFDAGKKLKSTTGWANNGNGTDEYGFSMIPSVYQGNWSWIWTSTEFDDNNAIGRKLDYSSDGVFRRESSKTYGDVVRCVNNCTPQPTQASAGADQLSNSDTVTTLDGNTPVNGQGVWAIVSGSGGILADSSVANTSFSGLADSTYVLTWKISNVCGASTDSVIISFVDNDGIRKLVSSIALDGLPEESFWDMDKPIDITNNGSTDNTAFFNVLWDNTYLYVGVVVTDANLCTNGRAGWYDDGIEICIDGNHSGGSTFDDYDMQFVKPIHSYWIQEMNGKNDNVIHQWFETADGYSMEFAIPWSDMNITPVSGDTIGFNIVMNDDDNCSYAHNLPSQLLWQGTGQYYTSPSLWGDIILSGSTTEYEDDYLAIINPNGFDFLINGKPFTIEWVSHGVNTVDIEYSTNNGSSWNPVATGVSASTGSYTWNVNATASQQCKIRILNSDSLNLNDVSLNTFTISEPLTGVTPMVIDDWHVYQWPYNAYYPVDPAGINGHVGNACGPTALSRILHKWEHPIVGNGSLTFTDNAGHIWSANFGATTYNFDNMPASLPFNSTEDEYGDAATLFYHAATAMNDVWGSGTDLENMGYAMETYFRYTSSQAYRRKNYNRDEWITTMKNELDSGRVLLVQGMTREVLGSYHENNNIAGHWYVCDGYNESGEFHVCIGFGDYDYFYDANSFAGYAYNLGILTGLEPDLSGKELTLITPNGGETFLADNDTTITWTSTNVSNIKIEYTLDNGEVWNEIIASTPAAPGTYTWSVPDTASNSCKVKISDASDVNVYDKSDEVFTIGEYNLTIISPNGNECFIPGSTVPVTWENTPVAEIKLEYTVDNGNNWNIIALSTPASTGSYNWVIPDSASLLCKIRISDISDPSVFDDSDGVFEITNESSFALDFDGTDDYVTVDNIPHPSNDFTIEAWIKPESITGTHGILFWYGTNDVHFRVNNDGSLLYGEAAGSWNYVISSANSILSGEWNHVAVTKQADNCNLFINGVNAGYYQFDNDPVVNTISIGARKQFMDYYFDGIIDEVRIWNIAKTQQEIQSQMNQYITSSFPGLLACWRFNDGSGQTILDLTNNNYDGELGSSPGADDNDPIWIATSWPYDPLSGFICGDLLIDSRDGNSYETVLIGSQCWMKENLSVGTMISGLNEQADNSILEKYCYNDEPDSCDVYGGLYQWAEAMQYVTDTINQGICPAGWRIPTDLEWMVLEGTADSQYGVGDPIWLSEGWRGYDAGKNLKSSTGWNGTDLYGFNALPAGRRSSDGSFSSLGTMTYHWISKEYDLTQGWSRYLRDDYDHIRRGYFSKFDGRTIRCIKD